MRAPRVHHQYSPDELVLEAGASEHLEDQVQRRGHVLYRQPILGIGAAIHRVPTSDVLAASLDARFSLE
jgi:hypothetical protein